MSTYTPMTDRDSRPTVDYNGAIVSADRLKARATLARITGTFAAAAILGIDYKYRITDRFFGDICHDLLDTLIAEADRLSIEINQIGGSDVTKLSAMIPSKYLKARDIPREGLELTIAKVESSQLTDQKTHEAKTVFTLHWQEPGVKPLTLNGVNTNTLIAWFGDVEHTELIGKPVTLVRMMAQVYNKMQWTVRIEPPDEVEGDVPDRRFTDESDEPPF